MIARKKSLLMLCLVLVMLLAVLGTIGVLMRHEPDFYRSGVIASGDERIELSSKCIGKAADLVLFFKEPEEPKAITFFAEEINSFFKEEFGAAQKPRPWPNRASAIRVWVSTRTACVWPFATAISS